MPGSILRRTRRWVRHRRRPLVLGLFTALAAVATLAVLSSVNHGRFAAVTPESSAAPSALETFGWTRDEREQLGQASAAEGRRIVRERAANDPYTAP